jgi:hypothetical protein
MASGGAAEGDGQVRARPGPRIDSTFTFEKVLDELERQFLGMPLIDILGAAQVGLVGTRAKRDRAIDDEMKRDRPGLSETASSHTVPDLVTAPVKDFRAEFAVQRLAQRMISRDFKSRTNGETLAELGFLITRPDPPEMLLDAINGIAERVMLKALTESPIRLQRIRMLLWALHPNAITDGSSLRSREAPLQDDLRESLAQLSQYRDAYSNAFRRYGLVAPADMDLLHALGALEDGFVIIATILLTDRIDESSTERRTELAALFAKATVGVVCALYPGAADARFSQS